MSYLKQFLFGVHNCTCNKRRKDGFHNLNCASWKNTWSWRKKHILAPKSQGSS